MSQLAPLFFDLRRDQPVMVIATYICAIVNERLERCSSTGTPPIAGNANNIASGNTVYRLF